MNCQDCKKQQAVVHITQIINNEKVVLALCKDCAAKRGFHSPLENASFPLADFIQQKFAQKSEPVIDIKCPRCGMTFEDFTRQGRFGCGACYHAFRTQLEPILRKIHGSSLHKGKLPVSAVSSSQSIKEEERLESELKRAIDGEDFERAADLRDKLRSFRESYLSHKAE
jgi:protein arginine kinase activator